MPDLFTNEPAFPLCAPFLSLCLFITDVWSRRKQFYFFVWSVIFGHCCPFTQSNIQTPTALTFYHITVMNHLRSWGSRGEKKNRFLFPLHWQLNLDSMKLHRFHAFKKLQKKTIKKIYKKHTFQFFLYKNFLFEVGAQESLCDSLQLCRWFNFTS